MTNPAASRATAASRSAGCRSGQTRSANSVSVSPRTNSSTTNTSPAAMPRAALAAWTGESASSTRDGPRQRAGPVCPQHLLLAADGGTEPLRLGAAVPHRVPVVEPRLLEDDLAVGGAGWSRPTRRTGCPRPAGPSAGSLARRPRRPRQATAAGRRSHSRPATAVAAAAGRPRSFGQVRPAQKALASPRSRALRNRWR